jgi:hypothetical protein
MNAPSGLGGRRPPMIRSRVVHRTSHTAIFGMSPPCAPSTDVVSSRLTRGPTLLAGAGSTRMYGYTVSYTHSLLFATRVYTVVMTLISFFFDFVTRDRTADPVYGICYDRAVRAIVGRGPTHVLGSDRTGQVRHTASVGAFSCK